MTNPDHEELVKLADQLGAIAGRCSYEHDRETIIAATDALRRLASSDGGVKGEPEPVAWPANLNPRTLDLVQRFALALAKKLRLAEEKYGHTDGWSRDDWEAECRDHLYQHLEKGDPRDVAAYCAFMWHHGWITYRPEITAPPADAGMREAYSALCLPCESQASDNLEGALHDIERLSAQGKPTDDICIRTLKRALKQIARAEQALTAPGATTKSDGGAKAGSSPILANEEEQRARAHGMTPVGTIADASGCTEVGPSDPSSTRSENQIMNDDQIKHMVDRFLMWKLPESFNPDAGISYTRPNWPESWPGPVGTNLFDAVQATAMVRHMLEGLPSTRSDRWVCAARQRGITLDPRDCDWPVCGCDPLASKVLDTIAESGFVIIPKDPSSTRSDVTVESLAYHVRRAIVDNYPPMQSMTREIIGDAAARALLDQFEIRRK